MTRLLSFWLSHRAELASLFGQHVLLVAGSTFVAVALGVPLGIFSARRPRLASPLMAVASIVQTIPSLAMFGFLLPVPFIGGVGARAALVVLILYGLLPIVRTTIAGLRGIDASIREAGVAMGMTPGELLRQVELPLALPSIVAGVRVAAVVGVGSATIAAAITTRRDAVRRRADSWRSIHRSPPSTASASSAAGTAPAKMTVVSTIDRPR